MRFPMQPSTNSWLTRALARVAGVVLAASALVQTARAEIAFTPERARLLCAGAAPEALKGHGNAVMVPALGDAQLRDCRVEIEFAVPDTALAEQAPASAYVELMGLRLARAAFPSRLAVNAAGISLVARPGGLTLAFAAETLFGGDRRRGAALILALRAGDGGRVVLSPTMLIERGEAPTQLR